MPPRPRPPHVALAAATLATVTLWFVAWRGLGGAAPLHVYRGAAMTVLSGNEARFFLGLVLPELLALVCLTRVFAARWSDALDARVRTALAKPDRLYALAAALAGELAYTIGAAFLGHYPSVDDEKTYLFQARLLLSGRLSMPAPLESAAFLQPFIVEVRGRWTGQYFWAHSAFLALGDVAGNPWLVPALEVGVTVFFGAKLAEEYTRDRRVGALAALLLATSPILVLTGATLHNANLAAACAAVSLWAVARLRRRFSVGASVALGVATGIALHNRPQDHAALLAGAAVLVLARYRGAWRPLLRRYALAAGVALPFVLLHLPLNRAVSGSVWHSGYWLFNTARGWAMWGFGVAPFDRYPNTYTPATAGTKVLTDAINVAFYALGAPFAALLALAPLAGVGAQRARRLGAPVVLLLAYLLCQFFTPFKSIRTTGPVYYGALAVALVAWTAVLAGWLHDAVRDRPWGRRLVPAGALAHVLVAAVLFWPTQLAELYRVGLSTRACHEVVERAGASRALVFVRPSVSDYRRSWLNYPALPSPAFDDAVLFALAAGPSDDPGRDARVARIYARGRPVYMAWCFHEPFPTIQRYDPETGGLTPLPGFLPPPAPSDGPVE